MDRRRFMQVAGSAAGAAILPAAARAEDVIWRLPAPSGQNGFGALHRLEEVIARARRLAEAPYQAPTAPLAPPFAELDETAYAAVRPGPAGRLELGQDPAAAMEPLPPGFVFTDPVSLSLVEGQRSRRVNFTPDTFQLGDTPVEEDVSGLSFSGVRLLQALNSPDQLEPVLVFQGASHFRARNRGGLFGAAARGLSLSMAGPGGEEVPRFTHLWVHEADGDALTVHALLDSPSIAGAFAFTARPGDATVVDVTCHLFPRADLGVVGIAPLSSMFLFGADTRGTVDDVRDAVHHSDGLQMVTGRGERIWRPLGNPSALRFSGFVDTHPRGFGLAQRKRHFLAYGDPTAGFERRPSVWVEPIGEWGTGQVVLVEIPLPNPANDNIVTFWRPDGGFAAGGTYSYTYRLTWCDLPPDPQPLARVIDGRSGRDGDAARLFAVDFDRSAVPAQPLEPHLSVSQGMVGNVELVVTPDPNRVRVTFRFVPGDAELSEFRLTLNGPDGRSVSETWLHRWTLA